MNCVADIPLFSVLSPEAQERLASTAKTISVNRNATIFHRGDPATGFYYLRQGTVKLANVSPNGQEKVIEIIQEGMTFGEAVMFIGKPFPLYAQALKTCHLLFIQRETVLQLMRGNPDFSLHLMAGLSRRMHGLVQELEAHCLQNASQRVIGYLLRALDDTPKNQRPPRYQLPAPKGVIASRLNLSPETFSRVLRRLQDLGILRVRGKQIDILDIGRLCKLDQCPSEP